MVDANKSRGDKDDDGGKDGNSRHPNADNFGNMSKSNKKTKNTPKNRGWYIGVKHNLQS
jgi:hypothetical protein